ncbi:lipopolysaccharide biosynthesis protein [Pseudaminobacter soli (ex Li et al. 2025)]|uniref:Lipopolysaccharide biosynthesis protein n=1 Tax=Pseudaminobacter soli (ex Li et al. 2025) TaxID=1295366 RepID=A0A2P7SGK8_9HYPH|nr:lipopolysaccharide biosynthesis protein [Mesorhizobium soli]PSJ61624.1 lipopolysaccharide biosynthesis protein [Mesorhizobium soli]
MAPAINLKTVTNNVGWSVLSKTSTFGLKFVTVPILARILTPQEFGVVAVAQTVVMFLTMIGSAGLATSLVLQKEEDMETVHSVFWANLLMATVMGAVLYLWAEPFAGLLGAPDAAYLLRIMALLIPIQLCGDVAYSLLARRMAFDKDAAWSVISECVGAVVALGLALLGWGVWALVAQLFSSALVRLGGLFYATGYRPSLSASPRKIAGLTKYSLGITGSEIFNFITFQSPLVVVSRHLGLTDAGAYSAANRFSSIPNQVVLSALMGVLFPVFSHMHGEQERRSNALMLSTQVCTIFLAPMMFGIWAVAEPAMLVIFGKQWASAWPVLGLLALSKGIMSPCSTFIPYLKGAGRSNVLWWVAVIRAALVYGAVSYGAMTDGLVAAMVWLCVANAVTLIFYSWAVFRTNGTAFLSGLYVTSRPMITAVIMAVAVRFLLDQIKDTVPNAVWQLVIGSVAGAIIYGLLVLLTERALLRKLLQLVKDRRAPQASAEASS